jgi:hypothetical protein
MQPIIRQVLALFAGFLLQHGIQADASNSASLIAGALIFGGAFFWSWLTKLEWSKKRNLSGYVSDDRAAMLRKALGALVSQGLAALAGWWQAKTGETVNAADPAAVILFLANLGASKVGFHQKVAAVGARSPALIAAALLSVSLLSSCEGMMKAAMDNRPMIEGVIQYGVKTGIDAGYTALEKKAAAAKAARESAKNPAPQVNPPATSCKMPAKSPPAAPGLVASSGVVTVPDYGARVAASFKTFTP